MAVKMGRERETDRQRERERERERESIVDSIGWLGYNKLDSITFSTPIRRIHDLRFLLISYLFPSVLLNVVGLISLLLLTGKLVWCADRSLKM